MLVTSIFSFSHVFKGFPFKGLFKIWNMWSRVKPLRGLVLELMINWLVVLRFNATLTAKVISWQLVMHMCFLAFTNTNFFPKPPTTFLTCFSRGEKQKYTRKKFCLNRVSNSQPPGHGSEMLTNEPSVWGELRITPTKYKVKNTVRKVENAGYLPFLLFPWCF